MFGGGEVKRKEGVRGWWGKKGKEKRKKKEKRSGTWVVGEKRKEKKGGKIERQQRECGRKIGKKDVSGVVKYKRK